jgi:hypothetical protein
MNATSYSFFSAAGFFPADLILTTLFNMLNKKGAPRETAMAVMSQPHILRNHAPDKSVPLRSTYPNRWGSGIFPVLCLSLLFAPLLFQSPPVEAIFFRAYHMKSHRLVTDCRFPFEMLYPIEILRKNILERILRRFKIYRYEDFYVV